MWTSSVNYVSSTDMFLCYQYVIGTTSKDCKGPEVGVSPCEVEAVSLIFVNVWIAWNTHFLIIAKANSKFGKNFIFLYHCIFGQSFYAVQRTVHPTNCDIVCIQTNCDVAGEEQKQFQIFRGIFTRWVRLVGGGFCNKANLLSFTSTSNDHNRHESVNFSA